MRVLFVLLFAFASDAAGARRDPSVIRGHVAGGAADVAIWLEREDLRAAPPSEVRLKVDWPRYTPRVQVVPLGSTLVLENPDDTLHTARGHLGDELLFNVATVGGGWSRRVALEREGAVVVRCAVHRAMRAWVVVTRSPYHAVSDADGRFEIRGVPAGRYRVLAFRPEETATPGGEVVATIDVPAPATELELRLRAPARR